MIVIPLAPCAILAAVFSLVASSAQAAADPSATALAELVKPLLVLPGDSGGAWEDLEKHPTIRWGAGPVMLDRASPDGNFFARPGQASLAGRTLAVVASGARSMVFSVYLRDPAPPMAPEVLVAGLRQAGFAVAPARCPIDPRGAAPRRWYRLALARKKPAYLYAGPLQSGGSGYTLFLYQLPLMTQAEVALYTDDCGGAAKAPGEGGAARPVTGQAGIVAVIEALMRPVGVPAGLPWTALPTLPAVTWKSTTPVKMTNPWTDAGDDRNPRLLGGEFGTATTKMIAIATGDDRAANHFILRDGEHLPRGAVFDALARDGYAIAALRCGKPYTETSQAWFRISAPRKQPAILYRAHHSSGGVLSEDYALRLDNILPPAEPGQTPAAGGRCPG
ncbi:MAG: hypothetical protein JWP23_1195 [Phenylobacterium sp.]|nr:hypothetical protein [Phenylobacterium sp.]